MRHNLIFLLVIPLTSFAENVEPFFIGSQARLYTETGDDYKENIFGWRYYVGYNISSYISFESGFFSISSIKSEPKQEIDGLDFASTVHIPINKYWNVFTKVTLSLSDVDNYHGVQFTPKLSLGTGVNISKHFKIDIEYEYSSDIKVNKINKIEPYSLALGVKYMF